MLFRSSSLSNALSRITTIEQQRPPIGTIIYNIQNGLQTADPSTWILCDGGLYDRTTYAVLFSYIGTTFGSSTSTNFRVPNYSGAFIRCYGSQTYSGKFYTGSAIGTPQTDAITAHTHAKGNSGNYLTGTNDTITSQNGCYSIGTLRPQQGTFNDTGAAQGAGVNTDTECRPFSHSVYAFIRAY